MSRSAAAATLAATFLSGCLAATPFDEGAWRQTVEGTEASALYAPHRDRDGRFFNPWLRQQKSFGDFLRWRFSRAEDMGAHAPTATAKPNDGAYLGSSDAPPSLTHVGHATFALQWGGPVIVTDPFFGKRAAIPRRLLAPAFGPEQIPAGAVVVISHNHYDHLDADSVEALAPRARFLCPAGLADFLRKRGVRDVRELDWWESVEVDGTRFTCLPAQHWSRRLGQAYNETLWCSWLLERGGRRVYYGGDSGYFKGYREIGRRYPGIDVALLGVGAFAPRWFMHYAHMDTAEVLRAFEELGARTLVPAQWGVLKLGDEPAAWPAVLLEQEAAALPALAGRVRLLPVGGRLLLE